MASEPKQAQARQRRESEFRAREIARTGMIYGAR